MRAKKETAGPFKPQAQLYRCFCQIPHENLIRTRNSLFRMAKTPDWFSISPHLLKAMRDDKSAMRDATPDTSAMAEPTTKPNIMIFISCHAVIICRLYR